MVVVYSFLVTTFLWSKKIASQIPSYLIENLTRYVDPYIGTGFHGHVFLGANVPFGAVQLGAVNLSEGATEFCINIIFENSRMAKTE